MKHWREFQYVSKNERKLSVDNISLCDESKSREISENKLHQTSNSHISKNKFPAKGVFEVLGSFREPQNP